MTTKIKCSIGHSLENLEILNVDYVLDNNIVSKLKFQGNNSIVIMQGDVFFEKDTYCSLRGEVCPLLTNGEGEGEGQGGRRGNGGKEERKEERLAS